MPFLLLPLRLLFLSLRIIIKVVLGLVRIIFSAAGSVVRTVVRGGFILLGFSDDVPVALFSAFTRLLASPKNLFSRRPNKD